MDIFGYLVKWVHLLSIVGVLGSIFCAWLVLVPALGSGETEGGEATAAMWRRLGIAQGVLWLFVFLTGFYNYFTIGPNATGTYNMLAGMKIALAVIMALLSMAMAHPVPGVEGLRRARATWYLVLSVLGILVLGLSANMNMGRMSGLYRRAATPVASPLPQPAVPPTAGAPAR